MSYVILNPSPLVILNPSPCVTLTLSEAKGKGLAFLAQGKLREESKEEAQGKLCEESLPTIVVRRAGQRSFALLRMTLYSYPSILFHK